MEHAIGYVRLACVIALALSPLACGGAGAAGPAPVAPIVESPYPPSVLSGEAELHCTINAKENGTQQLVLKNGGGLEFDVVVSPIVDGKVEVKNPEKGGAYRFTSHLAKPAVGKLAGVGEVQIEELETKVAVEMKRYNQKGGPGTELTFTTDDMSARGIYVEFAGRARAANGDRYAFRVNLGAPTEGSGRVVPADANYNAPIAAKMVVMQAPVTTVISKTTIQRTP